MSNNHPRCNSSSSDYRYMGLAGSVARTSYILPGTLETENQMLFLVVSRGIIMLSLGKNKIVI